MAEASCISKKGGWGPLPCRPQLLLSVMAFLACLVLLPPLAAATDVYILNLFDPDFYTDADTKLAVRALQQGFMTSFNLKGYTVGKGDTVKFLKPDSSASSVTAAIQAAVTAQPSLLAVVGPYGDDALMEAKNSDVVKQNNLVMVSPRTYGQGVRGWDPHVYFTITEPMLGLLAFVDYLINQLFLLRISYMYIMNSTVGGALQSVMDEKLKFAGYLDTIRYAEPGVNASINEAAFEAFADADPQAILLYGVPGAHTDAFVARVMTDVRTENSLILYPAFLQNTIDRAMAATGFVPAPSQLLTVWPTQPIVPDAPQQYIQTFFSDLAQLKTKGLTDITDSEMESSVAIPQLMMEGWIGGRAIRSTLMYDDAVDSPTLYQAAIFDQQAYLIAGEYFLGWFAGECAPLADLPICECNQGGRTMYLLELTADGKAVVDINYVTTLPSDICESQGVQVAIPINVLSICVTDNARDWNIANAFLGPINEVIQWHRNTTTAMFQFNHPVLNTTVATYAADGERYINTHRVSVKLGFATPQTITNTTLVLDPTFATPHPHNTAYNYIMLMPTVDQELYVFMHFIANYPKDFPVKPDVTMATLGMTVDDAAGYDDLILKTMTAFGLKPGDHTQLLTLDTDADLTNVLRPEGFTVLLGISPKDVDVIAAHLQANPGAAVGVAFSDFAVSYDRFVAAFTPLPVSVQARLITMTNLPHWADISEEAHSASLASKLFHDAIPDSTYHTPVGMQTFFALFVLNSIDSAIPNGKQSAETMLAAIYQQSTLTVGEVSFGPYITCNATKNTSTAFTSSSSAKTGCTPRNYGANNIAIINMARALDPSVPPVMAAYTPPMTYTPPKPRVDDSLNVGALVGIIVGCVVGAALIVVLIVVIYCCCCSSTVRANRTAPKEPTEPVTLVFTDIESSTALWAAVPQIMPDAVAMHHKLIRQLIKKYNCYEVKTIGDSFMIASKDPYAAVQLARDVQLKFLKHDWGTTEIDSSYRSFEMRRRDEVEDYQPPTAMLNPEVYKELWNGLRVRIGIHTGLSDIRCDERTKGYDYYGETSNMAARTEAIGNGGQVLLTESAYWALSHAERAELNCVSLGPQGLRGVPYAVEMYQLNAVPGRQHAALRTEIEAILPNDGMDDNDDTNSRLTGTEALLSSAGTMTGAAAAISVVLTNCFSPYPPANRAKELMPLMQKWNIPVPPRNRRVSEEDYCQGLINRLAIKMSTVAQMRQKINGPSVELPSSSAFNASGRRVTAGNGGGGSASGDTTLNATALNGLPSRHTSFATPAQSTKNPRRLSAPADSPGNPLVPDRKDSSSRYQSIPVALANDEVLAFEDADSDSQKRLSDDSGSADGSAPYDGSTATRVPPQNPPPSQQRTFSRDGRNSQTAQEQHRRSREQETEKPKPAEPAYPTEDDEDAVMPMTKVEVSTPTRANSRLHEALNARRNSESLRAVDVTDDDVVSVRIQMPDYIRKAKSN